MIMSVETLKAVAELFKDQTGECCKISFFIWLFTLHFALLLKQTWVGI